MGLRDRRGIIAVAALTLAMLLSTRPSSSQNVQTFSLHYYKYCEGLNSALKAENTDDIAGFTSYVFGFVSAAAIFSGDNNLGDLSGDDVVAYMKRYCAAHPEITMEKAARDLFNTHAGRQ